MKQTDIEITEAIPIKWVENRIKQLEHELHEDKVKNLGISIGFDNYKKTNLLESLKTVLDTWRSEVK